MRCEPPVRRGSPSGTSATCCGPRRRTWPSGVWSRLAAAAGRGPSRCDRDGGGRRGRHGARPGSRGRPCRGRPGAPPPTSVGDACGPGPESHRRSVDVVVVRTADGGLDLAVDSIAICVTSDAASQSRNSSRSGVVAPNERISSDSFPSRRPPARTPPAAPAPIDPGTPIDQPTHLAPPRPPPHRRALARGMPKSDESAPRARGNSPGCRAAPATRLQNGPTGTKERPASTRAHPQIFLRPRVEPRSMATSGMTCRFVPMRPGTVAACPHACEP